MQTTTLGGGFTNTPHDSARAFRATLDVLSRPGRIADISGAAPPAPLSVAAASLLLTLCDPETPLWLAPSLGTKAVTDWLRFHTGAPLVATRAQAMFAIGGWDDLMPITDFTIGTPEYPNRSATLIVEMESLDAGNTAAHDTVLHDTVLKGPGIKDEATLALPDSAPFQDNATLFPLGLDFFFTAGTRIAALPRSTKVRGTRCT